MIIYNMRHRGPFEYDKFALNVLQYHNEVTALNKEFKDSNSSLLNMQKQISDTFYSLTGKYSSDPLKIIQGASENLFLKMLNWEEN